MRRLCAIPVMSHRSQGRPRRSVRKENTVSYEKDRDSNGNKRECPGDVVEVKQDAALHIVLHAFDCRGCAWTVLSGKFWEV